MFGGARVSSLVSPSREAERERSYLRLLTLDNASDAINITHTDTNKHHYYHILLLDTIIWNARN